MTAEQIAQATFEMCQLDPAVLRKALNTSVQVDETHTITVTCLVAQSLINISRNPHTTKETRADALRVAKLFLSDVPEITDVEEH